MNEKVTFNEIRAIQKENAEGMKQLREAQAKYAVQQAKYVAEYAVQQTKYAAEYAARQAEYAAQQAEYAARRAKDIAESKADSWDLRKSLKALREELGGMGGSNGEYAENYFAHAVEKKKVFAGQRFDEMATNVKAKHGKMEDEYDVVLYNGDSVAIIEIKYKARTADLDIMVERKVPHFRALFPYYQDYKIYLGLGSMSFDDYVTKKAHELGIGLLRQDGKTVEAEPGPVKAY